MGDVQTGSSSSQSASPIVRNTVDTLAGGVAGAYSPGATLYRPPGAATTSGWKSSLDAANDPAYTGGIKGAMSSYANRAAGNELGVNDPLYAAQRQRLIDSAQTSADQAYNQSGLFGSDQNREASARGVGDAIAASDLAQRTESYGRQAEGANMLAQLFQGAQLPGGIQQSVGAAQDADAAAKANGPTDLLAKLTGILSGNAAAAGTNTTQQTPLWKLLLGGAATAAGAQ